MAAHILEVRGAESIDLLKALASETRVQILSLLADGPRNINELVQVLGLSQPTVTKHMQMLEQAGLTESEYMPGVQGMQKKCTLRYDRYIISFETTAKPEYQVEEIRMPIGLYTLAHAAPTCGLVSAERPIGILDDPQSFYHPDRSTAQLLYLAEGFVEYVFPCMLPSSMEITRLELSMEVCSEAPHNNNDYPSDITVWINNVEIGTWVSPGDFGGKRGRLNPSWWSDSHSQYGMLKIWSVDREGSYVDGTPVSGVTLKHLLIVPKQTITVRIGVKPDAEHQGGINLFGHGFGNYDQDLLLRLHYVGSQRACKTNGQRSHAAVKGGETVTETAG